MKLFENLGVPFNGDDFFMDFRDPVHRLVEQLLQHERYSFP